MLQTILQALVPVVFVAGLGWLVGRLEVLDPQRIRSITTFIVTVALPAALFVGVFSFSPSQLENGKYLLTMTVALMGTWAVGFGLARIAFHRTTASAGMLAMNSSFPDLTYRIDEQPTTSACGCEQHRRHLHDGNVDLRRRENLDVI